MLNIPRLVSILISYPDLLLLLERNFSLIKASSGSVEIAVMYT
jgi:hypothetical protein